MAKRSKIEKADLKVAKAAAPARQSLPVRLLGTLSELADQPPLISFCAGLFVVGLVTRDRRLASAGGRMLAAELLATEMKSRIKHRVDRTHPRAAANGNSSNESFGCATTAKPFKVSDLSWPISGVLGLGLVLRVLRVRKNNKKPKA